jgi:hypothetical protein
MGYQSRKKSPKSSIHSYKKPLREKRKDRKRIRRGIKRPQIEKKHIVSEQEISEVTLKRLHNLGIQKFGSSPFNQHFDRWLMNVIAVLGEFESHPNINVDDEFVRTRSQTLSAITLQLENLSHKEATLDQELKNLSDWRNRLKQITKEYAILAGAVRGQRNREIRRLNGIINRLKKDQDDVIRMKTGLFHGISKKDREQKEMAIVQELNNRQTELELVMLDFNAKRKELQGEYDRKKEPVMDQIKKLHKKMQSLEMDDSLEERWFACETLIDALNTFLQRKATQSSEGLT